jgi:nucleotide-binding universal stress UspA family protein
MKILLTHDGSEMADVAVPTLRALANALGAEAEIMALCITSRHAHEGTSEANEATASLDRIQTALRPHDVSRVIRAGSAGPLIIETADELACDLTSRRSWFRSTGQA